MAEHRCDERCVCPVHGTPLLYWRAGDDHACQDPECVHAHGMESDQDWAERMVREGRDGSIADQLPSLALLGRRVLAGLDRKDDLPSP